VSVDENASGKKGKYSDDYFMETAMKFMELAKPESYNNQRPFFLYLPFTIARANVALGKQTGNGMEVPDAASYSGESWPPAEKNKAAMITRLDDYVGVLMKKLEGYKIDRNTIIIFTSTAGPHKEGGVDPAFFNSAGPLRGAKRDLNEGAIRVPLIVSWPARVKAGGVSDLPCASWDIFPTAADIVKAPAPGETDGISLLPALTGQTQTNRHEFLYWELHEPTFKQAVRMGDWKIVRSTFDGPPELYNLKTDPGEKTNVAGKNPDVVMKISSYLRTARTDDKNWPASGADQTAQK
jgi:arylsulfatase A-like enzyme